MAEIVTIARPYAEAVFRLAKEHNRLQPWSDMLGFAASVTEDPQMRLLIGDPNLTRKQIEDLFLSVGAGRLDESGQNLIRVLVDNHRLELLPEIRDAYEQLRAQEENVLEAKVISAFPMSDGQLDDLMRHLEAKFKQKIHPHVVVDPELIGGIKVQVGDEVLDASIRGKLEAMAFALTR